MDTLKKLKGPARLGRQHPTDKVDGSLNPLSDIRTEPILAFLYRIKPPPYPLYQTFLFQRSS